MSPPHLWTCRFHPLPPPLPCIWPVSRRGFTALCGSSRWWASPRWISRAGSGLRTGRFSPWRGLPAEEDARHYRLQYLIVQEDAAVEHVSAHLGAGEGFSVETRFQRGPGSGVRLEASRIHPADEPAMLILALDISERRRAEAAERAAHAHYRALFDSLDVGFCVIEVLFDSDGRGSDYLFLDTNASFEKTSGIANAVGLRMRDVAPGLEQHWFDIYGEVARTGRSRRFEQEARSLHRWYSVYAFRLGSAESRRVAVLFEDITTRKKADQRRALLSELSDTIAHLREEPAIIRIAVRALGGFLEVNRCFFVELEGAGERVVFSDNYTRGGTTSLAGLHELAPFGGIEAWRSMSQGEIAVDDVTTDEVTREHAAAYTGMGLRSLMVQPFREAGRAMVVLVVSESCPRPWTPDEVKLVDDVVARVWPMVERARSERALIAARDELEQRVIERTARLQAAISELEAYSYSISHDLRAPLRAMRTYAGILVEECGGQISPQGYDYLGRIMSAAERMDRLIHDVLLFSRVAGADMELEQVELDPFILAIIETYPELNATSSEIEVVAGLGSVRANPGALTQCLANLLNNAVKFVSPNVTPKIRIWSEVHGDRLRLFVRDNGLGIPEELQEKIFGVFYQGSPINGDESTGIGLAIVRKAAERMGGRVGLESAPGEGSTFWLELSGVADA